MPSSSKVWKKATVSGVRSYQVEDDASKKPRRQGKNRDAGSPHPDRKKKQEDSSEREEENQEGQVGDRESSLEGNEPAVKTEEELQEVLGEEATRLREEIEEEKKEIQARAEKEAEEARQKAAEEGKKQGYEEGYRQGYEEGTQQARKDWSSLKEEMSASVEKASQMLQETRERYEQILKESEQTMVELSVAAAEKLLHAQLELEPEKVLNVVYQALQEFSQEEEGIRVYVNPEDLPVCLRYREELVQDSFDPGKMEIYPREEISRGSCRVETDKGVWEIDLEEEKERIKEKLLQTVEEGDTEAELNVEETGGAGENEEGVVHDSG